MDTKYRIVKNSIFKWVVLIIGLIAILPLFLIVYYILRQGLQVINWEFFISMPKPVGEGGGGILNALVGTLILLIIAFVLSTPIGIAAGIFASEYKGSPVANFIRLSVEILQGVPSIVIGIIAYIWVVVPMGKFSALAGGISLSIMMLPMVVKSTEETLNLIPFSLKESSLALGVPYHKTILKVVLPAGLSGIITGVLLGIARIAGETAPLLFTAFGNPFFNTNILKPIDALSLTIFNYATSPYAEWHEIAWGASSVLVIFVLILNIVTRLIVKKWKTQF
jgi:phosphate transport system permease protein